DAAHIADLKVKHYEIGMVLGYRTAYVLAPDHLDDFLARRHDRGPDLLAHPARVGGNKDFHRSDTYPADAVEHRPGRHAGIERGLADHFPRLDPGELDSGCW